MDDLPGVAVPEVVFSLHPLRHWTGRRTEPLVLGGVRLPWDISQFDCIDLRKEVLMISDRWYIAMRNERGCPDVEKLVDEALREVGLEV